MEHIFKTQDIQQLLTGEFEKHFPKNNQRIKFMCVCCVSFAIVVVVGWTTDCCPVIQCDIFMVVYDLQNGRFNINI